MRISLGGPCDPDHLVSSMRRAVIGFARIAVLSGCPVVRVTVCSFLNAPRESLRTSRSGRKSLFHHALAAPALFDLGIGGTEPLGPRTSPTIMPRYARRPSGQRRLPGPWKHGPMPVVGLVGGIGAGKSRVASELAARGAAVLDADTIGHALLDQKPSRNAVVARFGEDVLDTSVGEGEEPKIDRSALGRIVFAAPHALRALEKILHPRMRSTFEKAIRRVGRRREAPMVVLDAAVLFEAGWDDLCDAIVFIEAPDRVRRARIAESRSWSAEQLSARESAQWPLARKREQSDHVLINHGTPEELTARLDSLWRALTRRPEFSAAPDDRGDAGDRARPPVEPDRPSARTRRSTPGQERPGGPRSRSRRK